MVIAIATGSAYKVDNRLHLSHAEQRRSRWMVGNKKGVKLGIEATVYTQHVWES